MEKLRGVMNAMVEVIFFNFLNKEEIHDSMLSSKESINLEETVSTCFIAFDA